MTGCPVRSRARRRVAFTSEILNLKTIFLKLFDKKWTDLQSLSARTQGRGAAQPQRCDGGRRLRKLTFSGTRSAAPREAPPAPLLALLPARRALGAERACARPSPLSSHSLSLAQVARQVAGGTTSSTSLQTLLKLGCADRPRCRALPASAMPASLHPSRTPRPLRLEA